MGTFGPSVWYSGGGVGGQATPTGSLQPLFVEIAVQNLNRILPKAEAQFLIAKLAVLRDEIPIFVKVCQF